MKARIILTPAQQKKIEEAIKQHKMLKQINQLVKDYKGKSLKILKIKDLTTKRLNKWK